MSMHIIYLRILSLILVPIGIFALVNGIRILRKTMNTRIAFEGPADQVLRLFSLGQAATYAVWQKGIFFGKIPNSDVQVTIRNEKTGERLRLMHTSGHLRVNNGSASRTQLYSFFALPGIYSMVAAESNLRRRTAFIPSKLPSKKTTASPETTVQIRDHQPAYHAVFAILFLLVGIFGIIGGIIFIAYSFARQV